MTLKRSWCVAPLVGIIAIGSPVSAAWAQPKVRAPEAIYVRSCGYCHGHDIAPIIRGRGLPAEAIAAFVRRGQGAMPAFRPTEISPAELDALAKWISASPADSKEYGR